MPLDYHSSPDSDVFRIRKGKVRPLLRDTKGNVFEPVEPGAEDDPFRFQPRTLSEGLYGLHLVRECILAEHEDLAIEILDRLCSFVRKLVKEEEDNDS